MAFLEKFSDEERDLLIRFPYRAGLWISRSDVTGDPGAAEDEAKVLAAIIADQASGMFHSALTHEVMAELWTRRADWSSWDDAMDKVPAQAGDVIQAIGKKLTTHDCEAYRATVLLIATEVAKAFHEDIVHRSVAGEACANMRQWVARLMTTLRNQPYDPAAFLSVSALEGEALKTLDSALQAGQPG